MASPITTDRILEATYQPARQPMGVMPRRRRTRLRQSRQSPTGLNRINRKPSNLRSGNSTYTYRLTDYQTKNWWEAIKQRAYKRIKGEGASQMPTPTRLWRIARRSLRPSVRSATASSRGRRHRGLIQGAPQSRTHVKTGQSSLPQTLPSCNLWYTQRRLKPEIPERSLGPSRAA